MRLGMSVAAILWVLSISNAVVARAQDSVDVAMKRLETVHLFAFGPAGLGGGPSQGEIDFRTISSLPQDRALSLFQTLYKMGNTQAKGYALIGIRRLSPSQFNEIYRSLSTSKEEVTTERGCIVGHESLQALARKIQKDPEKLKFLLAN